MGENSPEKKSGCGLLNAVFGRGNFWARRSISTGSLSVNNHHNVKSASSNSKRRRGGSNEAIVYTSSTNGNEPLPKPTIKQPPPTHLKAPPGAAAVQVQQKQQQQQQQVRNEAASARTTMTPSQGYVNQGKRVPKEAVGISGELDSMLYDHQKKKGNANLVRASSNNMMIYGNLGNLRQPAAAGGGGGNATSYNNVADQNPKAATPNGVYPNSVMGNVVKKAQVEEKPKEEEQQQSASLCRALSTRMDPETLKIMGNEDYKNGNFAEALALYEAAIAIDPHKASYRSNKSAALTALGRILEAVFECREAIRMEPHYHRAHHRLSNLYLRLGEVEKAIYHFKHAGPEADRDDIAKAKTIQMHLNKCTEAKMQRNWNTLLRETDSTIQAGADSAPQIYALKAEALLKFRRHQEAEETLSKGPNFSIDDCTKYFGPIGNANLLVVRAQVDMAAGRFDDAMATIERAVRLDPNNKEASSVMRRARAVGAARSNGNELFKASKFSEACDAYGEGLDHDPHNSVLLCNRAACLSKLGHYDKAIDDCTRALNVRPSYSKARLRRADCNFKLGKWEASIEDYEMLQRETPDNEAINRALLEAQMQLKKQCGEVE